MLHYFIVNPAAGTVNALPRLKAELENIFKSRSDKYEIYETKFENDATMEIKRKLQERNEVDPSLHIRIYSAGGDGTAYECANGVYGYENVSFAILPTGSCNDFLKSFPDVNFNNLEDVVNADAYPLDVLKINDKICVNVCNVGYDAKTNADCMRFRKKMKSIHNAYVRALIINLLKPLGDQITMYDENDNIIYEGKSLLFTFSNGQYYGGGYRCAPLSITDDGLMDISAINKVSRLTFIKLVGGYKKGEHVFNREKYKKVSFYTRCKKARVVSEDMLTYCVDGEIFYAKELNVETIKHAFNFVIPKNQQNQ